MKSHASMNHIYRLVWSQVLNGWVAVAETSRGRGKGASRKLVAAALSLTAAFAQAAPDGGLVVSGTGSIAQSGTTTTVNQSTQNLSLTWKSFNIAPQEKVNFVQPSASALAVNRISDTNGTKIYGQLNANGQVYLINPNGILFGQGAQVNVGGLVASTLDINDASLSGNTRSFSGNGSGSIVNQGSITAASGGYVALLGNTVSNQGTITAPLGAVALGAGSAATLTFSGNSLVKMQVDQSVLNSLAENGGLIRADGGLVIMSAGAKDALLASVVNNTGVIEARTVDNHEGTITLLGGMTAGTIHVGGTLDASAPNGGNGGFIETSAAQVKVANDAKVTTAAPSGKTGTWLIDPTDFTIAASGGDMTGAALGSNLVTGNVSILSSSGTVGPGTAGAVHVNDVVAWSANKLTLNAQNNININANLNGSGTASLALEYGQAAAASGNTATYNVNAAVNLPAGNNFSTLLGSDGVVKSYTVITSLGAAGSTTATDLQGMKGGLATNYALGSNIDATATSTWNTGAGFTPVGNASTSFTGTFDGLGHTVSSVTIDLPTTNYVGLFGSTGTGSAIRNVGLIGGSVIGQGWVGALVGDGSGAISNSYTTASVTGVNSYIGGLVGAKHYTSSNSSTISNSYSAGSVSGGSYVGGLVGFNDLGTISNSYATGSVSGVNSIGGLIGGNYVAPNNFGSVGNSYATGRVTGSGTKVGALVGENLSTGTVINNFWDSTVNPTLGGIASGASTGATGLTTAQMQTAANFAGFNFTATPGATGNNWVMVNADGSLNNAGGSAGSTRPMLASEYSTTINNAHQLQLMAMAPAASYTLGSNVNAASTGLSTDVWGSSGFVPVGNSSTPFTGSFDGLGRTISNLTQSNALNDSGLFGQIGAAGTVKNLGLTGVTIIKQGYGNNNYLIPFGALTGTNAGRVSNVYSTGTITNSGPDYNAFGGLVGINTGLISNAYSSATLSSGMWGTSVGGLVGINSGTISSSYAAGAVTGSGRYVNVGGLVGQNTAGSIENSYAIGAVTSGGTPSSNAIGGLVGLMSGGSIANAYATGIITATQFGSNYGSGLIGRKTGGSISNSLWDTTTSNRATGIGYPWDSQSGVTGLTSSQMMQMASFSSWNTATPNSIANTGGSGAVWRIYEGHTAPLLTSFMTGLTLSDASVTYNGTEKTGTTTALSGVSGIAAKGTNAGTYLNSYYSSQQGYDISGGNLTINAAALSAISLSGTRAYDGTFDVAASIFTLSGLVSGQTLTLSGTGTVADKNVGTNKTVTLGSLALGDSNNGLASNYTFTGGTQTANITAASLTLGSSDVTKTYDGGLTAAGTAAVTSGTLFGGDTLSGGTFAYTDKNVASGSKTVTTTGVTVNDGNSGGNYTVSYADNTTSSIGAKALTASVAAPNKTYDGNASAAPTLSISAGLVGTETVTATGTASFNSKDVLAANLVTVNSTALADGSHGGLASNYSLVSGETVAANITAAALTATVAAPNKTYNGSTTAAPTLTITGGLVGTETVTATGTATFNSKDVLAANLVTVNSTLLADGSHGGLASNYSLVSGETVAANITAAALTATVAAPNKTYNGSTTAAPTLTITGGLVGTETVTATGTASFNSKDVLAANLVTVNSTALADGSHGGLASNYSLDSGETIAASIGAKALTASVAAPNKTYDGNASATPTLSISAGLVGTETVTATGTATFNSKDVLAANLVTVNSTLLADGTLGGLASNYSLVSGETVAASIGAKALTYTATPASFFSGQTPGSLSGTVNGLVTGDTLAGSTTGPLIWTTSADANSQPGPYPIDGSGLVSTNYSFVQAPPNATALTLKPGTPPAPVLGATIQLVPNVLSRPMSIQPDSLNLSPSITVAQIANADPVAAGDAPPAGWNNGTVADTTMRIESMGLTLQIVDDGIRLPNDRVNVSE